MPAYPCPRKCEGTTRTERQSFVPSAATRCQKAEGLVWHEETYSWLCPSHVAGYNRRRG